MDDVEESTYSPREVSGFVRPDVHVEQRRSLVLEHVAVNALPEGHVVWHDVHSVTVESDLKNEWLHG
jgi:hypothetical protein